MQGHLGPSRYHAGNRHPKLVTTRKHFHAYRTNPTGCAACRLRRVLYCQSSHDSTRNLQTLINDSQSCSLSLFQHDTHTPLGLRSADDKHFR